MMYGITWPIRKLCPTRNEIILYEYNGANELCYDIWNIEIEIKKWKRQIVDAACCSGKLGMKVWCLWAKR